MRDLFIAISNISPIAKGAMNSRNWAAVFSKTSCFFCAQDFFFKSFTAVVTAEPFSFTHIPPLRDLRTDSIAIRTLALALV